MLFVFYGGFCCNLALYVDFEVDVWLFCCFWCWFVCIGVILVACLCVPGRFWFGSLVVCCLSWDFAGVGWGLVGFCVGWVLLEWFVWFGLLCDCCWLGFADFGLWLGVWVVLYCFGLLCAAIFAFWCFLIGIFCLGMTLLCC